MTVGAAGSVKSQAVARMGADLRASREAALEANRAHVADQGLEAAQGVLKAARGLAQEVVPAPAVAPVPPRKVDLDPEVVLLNLIRVGPGLEVERPRVKGRTPVVYKM
jgi:hypothetical protein